MPQLDFSTYASQLFWLTITFGALYLFLARSALPRLGRVLEERARRISDDLEAAESMQREAVALEESYEKLLTEARVAARDALGEARAELQAELDAKKNEANVDMTARLKKAEDKIAKAKTKALKDIEGIAADVCEDIISKLGGGAAAAKAAKAAVAQELKTLN